MAIMGGGICLTVLLAGFISEPHHTISAERPDTTKVSFQRTVLPIFHRYCLPCHTEDRMNPSELYLDSYENVMKGGRHGPAVISGKSDSSSLILKISPMPPFGDPMPFRSKRQFPPDTLQLLRQWIEQGARNN